MFFRGFRGKSVISERRTSVQQNIINTRDLEFQLFELHQVEDFLQYDRYSDHSRETLQAALDLLDEVREMRREVDRLHRLLDQFITD